MSRPGLVVVVDGPTQVGRSTTIRGLQRRWPQLRSGPLLEVGLDAALSSFGPASGRWHELILPHRNLAHDSTTGAPVWGPLGRELVAGMHRSAVAWAGVGFDVAVDHTLLDRSNVADLAEALDPVPAFHVGLVCDHAVLEERERQAGRRPGLASAELRLSQRVARRDLVLDTSESTTDELVDDIFAELRAWLGG